MLRLKLTLLLLALAGPPGCAYLRHSGKDLLESFHVGVGGSAYPGVLVHALVPLFGTTGGYLGTAYYLGNDYGYGHGWRLGGAGTFIGGQIVHGELGRSIAGFTRGRLDNAYLEQTQFLLLNLYVTDYRTALTTGTVALSRFDVGAHVLFVGASVGLDVAELLDFLVGLVGYDLLGDDEFTPRRAPFGPGPSAVPPGDTPEDAG